MPEPLILPSVTEEVLEKTKELISTIRQASIVFSDSKGAEVCTIGPIDCMPGDEVRTNVPGPEDVKIIA